jgi:hypothetical protein
VGSRRVFSIVVVGGALAACGLDVMGAGRSTNNGIDASSGTDARTNPPTTSDGGGEGGPSCGDITSNSNNCGACNHSCLDAGCKEGVCEPTLVTANLSSPHGVAVGPSALFIAENDRGDIRTVPFTGGPSTAEFATNQAPRAILFANSGIYWTQQRKVYFKKPGVAETPTFFDLVEPAGGSPIVVDGDDVFYGLILGERVARLTAALTGEVEIASTQPAPHGIAVDRTHVYWTSTAGTISRRPRDASAPVEQLITAENQPLTIAMDATRLYWTTPSAIRTATIGEWKPSTLVDGQTSPTSLVRDGDQLYWLDAGSKTVRRVGTNGGSVLTIARDERQQDLPLTTAIAFDATYVYWVASAEGTLKRVPK